MASKNETKKAAENVAANATDGSAEKQESSKATNTKAAKKTETGESIYTIDEFCNNAQSLFGAKPECVKAALREKGIEQCGRNEAEMIVKEFMKKEVK